MARQYWLFLTLSQVSHRLSVGVWTGLARPVCGRGIGPRSRPLLGGGNSCAVVMYVALFFKFPDLAFLCTVAYSLCCI